MKNEIQNDEVFKSVNSLLSSFPFFVVDVFKNGSKMSVVLTKKDGTDITTDELGEAYNIIYPRFSSLPGLRDLTLEVSSPGLGRELRDLYELTLFTNKEVKVVLLDGSVIFGKIVYSKDNKLTILVSDEEKVINFENINKVKLEYSSINKKGEK